MKDMAKIIVSTLTGMLFMPGLVMAGHEPAAGSADSFWIEADVIDVQPLVRVVQVTTPQEVCWEEEVSHAAHGGYRSHTPKVLGGIIGGVVGNQFGSGRGNTVMTVAGALLGASIGRDAAYRRQSGHHRHVAVERRCEIEQTVREEERLDGYRVTYEYGGHTFVIRAPEDPGPTIRVRVSVQPLTYNRSGMSRRHAGRKSHKNLHYKS